MRLEEPYLSCTTDEWTHCLNDTYLSFTVSPIDPSLSHEDSSLDCSKAIGSAREEGLAKLVIAQAKTYKLEGRVYR